MVVNAAGNKRWKQERAGRVDPARIRFRTWRPGLQIKFC